MTPAAAHDFRETGLCVDGLTVVSRAHRTRIVEDVSVNLLPGHVLGMVGESGSGKSTVAVGLLGLARRGLQIAAGSVTINGHDVLTMNDGQLREARGSLVSYVPQDPSSGLNPGKRIGWQLREALLVHPRALGNGPSVDDRIQEVLLEVGLPASTDILGRYPHQLSGGQQQRISIAMAFVARPRVIVLDEPTTGLDVTTQRRVLDTVRELTARHQVMSVYISHDLAVVAQIADSVAVMYAGRIAEVGPVDDVFSRPGHHYTAGLIEAAPSAVRASTLVGIEGRPPRPGAWPAGCAFANRCPGVQDNCRQSLPPLAPVGDDHHARCLHPVADGTVTVTDRPVPPAVPERPAALRVRGLVADYAGRQVLHGIDLDVDAGRCTAVVGESGSGKTTLARCLVGLYGRWSGEVTFDGAAVPPRAQDRADDLRHKLQYVFQNPFASLNPRMTVAENIEEPLRHLTSLRRSQRRERVDAILSEVALGGAYADRMPDQLSGGERQRVAIGRALIADPKLLVCDEITSALDVSVQALIVEQLRRLQRERGLSMIFITHNLAVVRSLAQDVVVLESGCVLERGPVEEVLTNPSHPYTKSLLKDLPDLGRPAAVAS